MNQVMDNIDSEATLRDAIARLQTKQAHEWKNLKAQLHMAHENSKPINVAISLLRSLFPSQQRTDSASGPSSPLRSDHLSSLLFPKGTTRPFVQLLRTVITFGIANLVAKAPGILASATNGFIKFLRRVSPDRANVAANGNDC